MAASVSDKFRIASGSTRPIATTLSLAKAFGATTASLTTATGWNTTTGLDYVMYRRQLNTTTGKYEEIAGTRIEGRATLSGTTLSAMTIDAGTEPAAGYAADGNTVVICAATAKWCDDLMDGVLVHANQDGTLKAGAVDNAAVLASNVVTTAKILDSNVTSTKVAAGFPVQMVATSFTALVTGTTAIPIDDTIPQITEGFEVMTQIITPKSATNILCIEIVAHGAVAAVDFFSMALFQDATVNALAATNAAVDFANASCAVPLSHSMVAGTVAATTFRVRVGPINAANTLSFNGRAGGRHYGAITKSFIKITEYKV